MNLIKIILTSLMLGVIFFNTLHANGIFRNKPEADKVISSDKRSYFISSDGTLLESELRHEKLVLTIYPRDAELSVSILSKTNSDQGEKYVNEELIFLLTGDSAVMKSKNTEAEKFVIADKYSGVLPDVSGELHYTEIYFSDAVQVIYVIKKGDNSRNGHWYLLKGEPVTPGSEYNTTLFELLKEDNKTTLKCFMRDMDNDKKLILLRDDCSVITPTEFFVLKEED
ncbi:MAG: hypothetical protein ABI462_11320 [Ignavibacteria bacterium]